MSDPQTRYINSYIDHAMGMLHEQLAQLLQTKSHLRVANDIVAEKDNIIKNLQNELEQIKTNASEKTVLAENAKKMEADYNALKTKVSHLESLMQQVNEMKKTILEKESAYNAMAGQKDALFKSMVAEKDSTYTRIINDKDQHYNKIITEKEQHYNNIISEKDAALNKALSEKEQEFSTVLNSKDTEIEELKAKIADLKSQKKTINRKKPLEVSKSIVEETQPTQSLEEISIELPVMLPVVQNENIEQIRETDDF